MVYVYTLVSMKNYRKIFIFLLFLLIGSGFLFNCSTNYLKIQPKDNSMIADGINEAKFSVEIAKKDGKETYLWKKSDTKTGEFTIFEETPTGYELKDCDKETLTLIPKKLSKNKEPIKFFVRCFITDKKGIQHLSNVAKVEFNPIES